MKRIMLLLLTLSLFTANASAGGPWPAGKDKGFFKLGQRGIVSDRFYNPDGQIIPITTTGVYVTSFYGEYGLSDRWTVKGYVPLLFRSTLNEVRFEQSGRIEPGDQFTGLSDADLGISYALNQNKALALGVTLRLGIPIGETSGGETGLLQSGDGEFNQLLQLDWGYSFWPKKQFVNGSIGFNNRTKGFSDEFHFGLDFGTQIGDKVTAILKTYTVRSFFNGDAPQSNTGIFSNNIQFVSFGPEVSYQLSKNLGLSAGAFFATAATNVLASPSLEAGLFWKL
ncbi:MAG: transporter [Bacteroidia bacterium]|nr:transporter [Bacteroidia bacterium]